MTIWVKTAQNSTGNSLLPSTLLTGIIIQQGDPDWWWPLPPQAVAVRDGENLAECDDEERHRAREVVEEGEDVVTGALSETHRQDEANAADQTWNEKN